RLAQVEDLEGELLGRLGGRGADDAVRPAQAADLRPPLGSVLLADRPGRFLVRVDDPHQLGLHALADDPGMQLAHHSGTDQGQLACAHAPRTSRTVVMIVVSSSSVSAACTGSDRTCSAAAAAVGKSATLTWGTRGWPR